MPREFFKAIFTLQELFLFCKAIFRDPPKIPFKTIRESETTIKIKFAFFRGGVGRGAERKIGQNAIFRGKRHDNKILKVKLLLSRNFVVMAQAPKQAHSN